MWYSITQHMNWNTLTQLAKKSGIEIVTYNPKPLDRIKNIGEAVETRKKLEELKKNEKVNILTKKQIMSAWNNISKEYNGT